MASAVVLITVDLDDTVWPCMPTIMHAEERLFEWLRENAPDLTARYGIEDMRDHRLSVMRQRPDIAHDLTRVRSTSLRTLLDETGLSPELATPAMEVFLEYRNQVLPFTDVPPVLSSLFDSYTLVSVTNGNSNVRQTSLRDCFHYSVSAEDVGAAKPDPDMFLHALQLADTAPDAALHLGDDPVRDVQAAKEIGMRTLWVNRSGQTWPEELPPADGEIRDFFQLKRWLKDNDRSGLNGSSTTGYSEP